MEPLALREDVTLADVLPTLNKRLDYVRAAFQNMAGAGMDRTELVLRIGRTGTGKSPHYRIDRREPAFSLDGEGCVDPDRYRYMLVADFHGTSHRRLIDSQEPEDILRENHWSTASLTYQEMQALLRDVVSADRGK